MTAMLELVAALAEPKGRSQAARILAAHLGCHQLIIFIRDVELDILLPAPAFPQTLPGGRAWHDFVAACADAGWYSGELPFPDRGTPHRATGVAGADGSVLVLLGKPIGLSEVEDIRVLLPLLGAAFRREQVADIAEGHATAARQAAEQARTLATALDAARHDLQVALGHARVAQERLSFLAEASARLGASLDITAILTTVTGMVIPRVAALCFVLVADDDRKVHQWALAYSRPERPDLSGQVVEQGTLDQALIEQLDTDIPRYEATLRADVPPALLRLVVSNREQEAALEGLEIGSSIVAPLHGRGRRIGTLWMGATTRRPFDERDREFAGDLARRAALAIDNGRLYQEAQAAIRARDAFLTIAAHELKTPVTAMVGYSQIVLRRAMREQRMAARDQRALQVIGQQAERLSRLLNTLLDISRIESGHFHLDRRPLDIGTLVETIVDDTAPSLERHAIELKRPEEPLLIDGDALRLEQVIQNILQNAVKYSPSGGSIVVVVERQAEHATLAVTDQGIGIPPSALPHVFQRFYRATDVADTSIGGLGIGLFVVHEIVTRHGGWIEVSSTEGVGSTFVVYLPLLPRTDAGGG